MEEKKIKIAIYARVSKDDINSDGTFQNPENQLMPLRELAKSRGWETEEFIERASGGSNRPIFQQMLGRSLMGQFRGILFYSFDRFSREGILDTLSYVRRLRDRGVWVKSLKEEWFDTESPFAELMLAQIAWFAEYERRKISDRTKAALARRKALGIKLGRPKGLKDSKPRKRRGYFLRDPATRIRVKKGSPDSPHKKNERLETGVFSS